MILGVESLGNMALALALGLLAAGSLGLGACEEEGPGPIGSTCADRMQCESGMCLGGLCVDPAGDEDRDGLVNRLEAEFGSDPLLADSDGDGIPDGVEVSSSLVLLDSDGDGAPDIIESAIGDLDEDCITDQFDAENWIKNSDLAPMLPIVCGQQGVCSSQLEQLVVQCTGGSARCVYDEVQGYASPELACDGVDENCDGVVDDGFTTAECRPQAFLSPSAGVYHVTSPRYRAAIGFGPVPPRTIQSRNYRAQVGVSPATIPQEAR